MAQMSTKTIDELRIEEIARAIEIIQHGIIESITHFDDAKKFELKSIMSTNIKEDVEAGKLKRLRNDLKRLTVNAPAEMTLEYFLLVSKKLTSEVGLSLENSTAGAQLRFEEILRNGQAVNKSDCEFLEEMLVYFEGIPEYEEAERLTKRIIFDYYARTN